jgi:hypothetical protein
MRTKEQLAEEKYPYKPLDGNCMIEITDNHLKLLRRGAFIAGYEAAQRWIPISEEPIPLDTLCIAVAEKGGRINCNFKTASDRDNACKLYGFSHYLPIPKLPTK